MKSKTNLLRVTRMALLISAPTLISSTPVMAAASGLSTQTINAILLRASADQTPILVSHYVSMLQDLVAKNEDQNFYDDSSMSDQILCSVDEEGNRIYQVVDEKGEEAMQGLTTDDTDAYNTWLSQQVQDNNENTAPTVSTGVSDGTATTVSTNSILNTLLSGNAVSATGYVLGAAAAFLATLPTAPMVAEHIGHRLEGRARFVAHKNENQKASVEQLIINEEKLRKHRAENPDQEMLYGYQSNWAKSFANFAASWRNAVSKTPFINLKKNELHLSVEDFNSNLEDIKLPSPTVKAATPPSTSILLKTDSLQEVQPSQEQKTSYFQALSNWHENYNIKLRNGGVEPQITTPEISNNTESNQKLDPHTLAQEHTDCNKKVENKSSWWLPSTSRLW